jgi:hypothetical protein
MTKPEAIQSYAEGDINSKERGTCARANSGKIQLHLVPFHLLCGTAKVFMHGALKYAPWNWAKGGKWSTAFDCLLRHLFKWWFCREECDRESGLHHLDHAMCNLLILIHYRDTYRDGDDRPPEAQTMFHESLSAFLVMKREEQEAVQAPGLFVPQHAGHEVGREEAA